MLYEWCQASGAFEAEPIRVNSRPVSNAEWSVGIWEGTHDDANHHKLSTGRTQQGIGAGRYSEPVPVFWAIPC